ncbi:hypothetical protein DICVIV_03033 [Dictyocaulus viviparus]|uniref:Uncharacterized protein n=1 Tax=Dictyocaulus viviparus TaxID=29172 RepID=A0A0D8Y1S4_DICVI|nr:hypothetical protein DICVIV_03033 [Dictyocaulus viviparus]
MWWETVMTAIRRQDGTPTVKRFLKRTIQDQSEGFGVIHYIQAVNQQHKIVLDKRVKCLQLTLMQIKDGKVQIVEQQGKRIVYDLQRHM